MSFTGMNVVCATIEMFVPFIAFYLHQLSFCILVVSDLHNGCYLVLFKDFRPLYCW